MQTVHFTGSNFQSHAPVTVMSCILLIISSSKPAIVKGTLTDDLDLSTTLRPSKPGGSRQGRTHRTAGEENRFLRETIRQQWSLFRTPEKGA